MAAAIAEAIESGHHLLAQAGTGTGKSLAYLTAALVADGPVVVSTATLALQHQLVAVDLPRMVAAVAPVLGRTPTFAVFKGRHHYLCVAKIGADDGDDGLLSDMEDGWVGQRSRLGADIARVTDWANDTDTGDRDDLEQGVSEAAWRQVSTSARDCVGATNCRWGAECFAEAARGRAREADIIVTNHALLSIDLMHNRSILPDHRLLIVDEAHELADRATSAARAELSASGLDRLSRRISTVCGKEVSGRLAEIANAFGAGVAHAPDTRLVALPAAVGEALTLLDGLCSEAIATIGSVPSDAPDAMARNQSKTQLNEVRETAIRCLADAASDVRWCEGDGRGRSLVVAPLSVAGLLGEELFSERTVVATSATLTLGGEFTSVAASLGLRKEDQLAEGETARSGSGDGPPWRGIDVGSPFEYRKQGILYVAAHLPRPTASGLSDAAADELVRLVTAIGGRTLGLFSSRRAADTAAEILRDRTDLPILLQGDETLPILVKKFKEDPATCLLGVMSLWQGVDVPGDACQLVVIDRLPFPRPDEPLSQARSAAADEAGGSGFAAVSVPHAAIRLAQGVGRLIRTSDDRGVAAVLDPRLQTARSYGPFLRKTLPPLWYTTDSEKVTAALGRLGAP